MIHSTHRFHGRSGLRFVYQNGSAVRGESLGLRVARNSRQQTWRVAVVVSRKVSKSAVVRNRIRRRIFELVRREAAGRIKQPYDLVFSAYSDTLAAMSHDDLAAAVRLLLDRAQLKSDASRPDHAIVKPKEIHA